MTENENRARRWSVGELARASGLTVRALHHYDEIGLLAASERTASGHRRYTESDLRRLYRIRALQSLGFTLEAIRTVLDSTGDSPASLRRVLEAQLANLAEQAAQLESLRGQLKALAERVAEPSMPTAQQFMTTLEMITMFEKHFTDEQRQALADRREQLGAETVDAAKLQMQDLVAQGLALIGSGTPASSPEAKDLVRRWDALGAQFHPGEATKEAARTMWQSNSGALSEGLPWSADELRDLVAYLARARA